MMTQPHGGIPWSWLHLLWVPLAGAVGWFMKRIDRLERSKVSRGELATITSRLDRMDERWDRMEERQNDRHADNTERLDKILLSLARTSREQQR